MHIFTDTHIHALIRTYKLRRQHGPASRAQCFRTSRFIAQCTRKVVGLISDIALTSIHRDALYWLWHILCIFPHSDKSDTNRMSWLVLGPILYIFPAFVSWILTAVAHMPVHSACDFGRQFWTLSNWCIDATGKLSFHSTCGQLMK